MSRYSPEALLALAAFFEKRAVGPSQQLTIKFHAGFPLALSEFLGKSISMPEVTSWLEKNQSVLSNKLMHNWYSHSATWNKYLATQINYSSDGNAILARMYTKPQSDIKDLEITESTILQPDGQIPPLWMYVGESFRKSVSKMDVDTAHNEFLVTAFQDLFGGYSEDFLQDMSFYIQENKKQIDKIRSLFSVKPKFLGGGADGVAFAISPTLILKIFKDEHGYHEAKKAIQRLYKNPDLARTEAMIYDVGQLSNFKNNPVYYYIMEKMKPVSSFPSDVKLALGKVIKEIVYLIKDEMPSKWRFYKQQIDDPNFHTEIKSVVSKAAANIIYHIRENPKIDSNFTHIEQNVPNLKRNWDQSLAEELIMKYLTSRTDLHLGNIGVTNYGEFRYYDPAYKGWTSNINTPYVPDTRT